MIPNDWVSVNSSNLSQVRYDSDLHKLYITFKNGQTYTYAGVPAEEAESLVHASSPGRYFLENIKGTYEFSK